MKLMVARRKIAGRAAGGCYRRLFMPEMDRRRMMMVTGFGALAALIPTPKAGASPLWPAPAAPVAAAGAYLFHDEFDGPAGSAPDPSEEVGCGEPSNANQQPGGVWTGPSSSGSTATAARTRSSTANPIWFCAPQKTATAISAAWSVVPGGSHRDHLGSPHQAQLPQSRLLARLVAVQ